jgi:hypothetical protein
MDGKYIESVHKKFGTIPIKTFLNLDLDFWLKNIYRKRIRLLYYMDYRKEDVKKFLTNRFGWKWYGGHHFENEYTKFVKGYLLPQKFHIDKRYVEFSALIRSGQKEREEALEEIKVLPVMDNEFINYVLKRLNMSRDEFDKIMVLPVKSYKDYDTYHNYFVENREMFLRMVERGEIPRTFFEKYTQP